jgi:hypothetical protein
MALVYCDCLRYLPLATDSVWFLHVDTVTVLLQLRWSLSNLTDSFVLYVAITECTKSKSMDMDWLPFP